VAASLAAKMDLKLVDLHDPLPPAVLYECNIDHCQTAQSRSHR
jgi:hypothetical protein